MAWPPVGIPRVVITLKPMGSLVFPWSGQIFKVSKMASPEISIVGENICAKIGEGPHWDTATRKLLWVDSFDYKVHLLDVETGEVGRKVLNRFSSRWVGFSSLVDFRASISIQQLICFTIFFVLCASNSLDSQPVRVNRLVFDRDRIPVS